MANKSRLYLIFCVATTMWLTLSSLAMAIEASSGSSQASDLQEIVVTAEKKIERIQDVPIPVTAINADSLVNSNELRLQDYYTQVPGLAVVPSPGIQSIAIRGITQFGGNPTASVTVDDVRFGSSTALGGANVPDIDPSELARIEVLRGPQGTLYGASSEGGLVKYVTIDPSTDQLSGRVEAGTSSVYNGAELGYNFRGAINVPLGDTLAVRASAFTRVDPGYIDNPVFHIDGVNKTYVSGGRIVTLWRPSDLVSLKVSALLQDTRADSSNDVDLPINGYVGPALRGLQQTYLPWEESNYQKLQAYSATLNAKIGRADLTSITAFNVSHFFYGIDYTWALGGLTESVYRGITGTPVYVNTSTDKFTQEIRVTLPLTQQVDWLMGAYFTHERGPYVNWLAAANQNTGVFVGNTAAFTEFNIYAEYSAFTDFTFHFTDQFSVQIGGRETFINQKYTEIDTGPLTPDFVNGLPSPVYQPNIYTNANAFTYLVTPKFKVSPDLMIYARLASGYRPGGANGTAALADAPTSFRPDKTTDYDVGVKGNALGELLSFDVSLFYIRWKDIQLSFTDPSNGSQFTGNGGKAKSQGVEISLESRPATGLTIAGWVDLGESELTQALPALTGVYSVPGDPLPFTSRFSGNLSLQQEFPLTSELTGFVGGAVSYVGDRNGFFDGANGIPAPRQNFPAYAKTNLRAGAKYGLWETNFFVNNLTDKRGVLNGGLQYAPPYAFVYIQPRTIGLSVVRRF